MDSAFITNLILASVRMATPLIFLSLAELYSQRAGLVHIGLEGLAAIGSLAGFLVSLITGNPLLGVLAGAVLTAIIQSSSASVGILQALAVTGQVSYGAAIPIIMGQNIGTCVTALISSIGVSRGAKRVVFSNDGLVYYTGDHYESFELLYGEP